MMTWAAPSVYGCLGCGEESADNRENKYLDQTLAEQHGILFIFYTDTGDGDKPIISAFKAKV